VTISNSTIAGNVSRTAAGAISGSATLTNSILVGNGLNCATGGTITLRRADDLCLGVAAGVLGFGYYGDCSGFGTCTLTAAGAGMRHTPRRPYSRASS
jgi:hypothetical protein